MLYVCNLQMITIQWWIRKLAVLVYLQVTYHFVYFILFSV